MAQFLPDIYPARLTAPLLAVLLLPAVLLPQARSLPIGDVERGRLILDREKCLACHGAGRSGVPDLIQPRGRGYSPFNLAGDLWNHAPAMWERMEKQRVAVPLLDRQQAADLFAFFFAAQYFEAPGDASRGRRTFRDSRCGDCHGVEAELRAGILPVSRWGSLSDAAQLAQRSWEHGREMAARSAASSIPPPVLTSQQMRDILAWAGALSGKHSPAPPREPEDPRSGGVIFQEKGCAGCHQGSDSFAGRPTRYGITEFAATLWRHALLVPQATARISYPEMRRLVEYLVASQFFEERGDPDRGALVYRAKGCATCHETAAGGAPDLSVRRLRMTSYDMVAVLWRHGPAMLDEMKRRNLPWPRFQDSEMADLAAFIHGPEFRRRPAAAPPAIR
jgi:mono/diheme cytochrome c family protein